jgi:nicotinamidase-related amidase
MTVDGYALIVIDVQKGFRNPAWGRRNNPACEANIALMIDAWRRRELPIVFVQHDSASPHGLLRRGTEANDLQEVVSGTPDLAVRKSVHSAFYGEPDLHAWLQARKAPGIVICGIMTNQCCETTARMGGNLGYDVLFALDATHTFDLQALDGTTISADEIARVTAANLHGEFATVVTTAQLVEEPRRSAVTT